MPRGKIASEKLNFKSENDAEVKEDEKVSTAKFTLIEPDAEDEDDDSLVQAVHHDFADTLESSRPNFKFTLLLVALFVAVNIGLIALLDNNKSSTTVQQAAARKDVETISGGVVQEIAVSPSASSSVAVSAKSVSRNPETVEKPVLGSNETETAASLPPAAAKSQPSAGKAQDLMSIIGRY